MQTFLPHASFARSASVLDGPRLGKQRVETLQVLRALELPDYGWVSHPAVRMWRGYTPALVVYGLACVDEWVRRGHTDSTRPLIAEFAPGVAGQAALDKSGSLPPWLGDDRLHRSHRSALVRKAPELYADAFDDADDGLDYFWPGGPDPVPRPLTGTATWVVRAPTAAARQRWLDVGVVGLGTDAGVAQPVDALNEAALREVLRQASPARRPGKALRQLQSLALDMKPGDPVAVVDPEDPDELVAGTVAGDYVFTMTGDEALPAHRRPVRWTGRLGRADVRPPALLQDPRRLFRVGVEPAALQGA